MDHRFATDLITFYHPAFWGLDTDAALEQWALRNPDKFWETIFRVLKLTGVTGIELTFGPGSIDNAVRAFGSAGAFRNELGRHGLSIVSAYAAGMPDWRDRDQTSAIVAQAERIAGFLVEAGANILVAGLPMRRTFGEQPPVFVDTGYMKQLAGVAHLVGEAISRLGVKLALHTEANSSLWFERDVDLVMAMTDPRYVWLCPDSCHITLGGGDPARLALRQAPRIALAHWKDAVGHLDRELVIDETIYTQQQAYMVELGQGVVDWARWSEAMLQTPGKDVCLIELDAAADPQNALAAGKAMIERLPGRADWAGEREPLEPKTDASPQRAPS